RPQGLARVLLGPDAGDAAWVRLERVARQAAPGCVVARADESRPRALADVAHGAVVVVGGADETELERVVAAGGEPRDTLLEPGARVAGRVDGLGELWVHLEVARDGGTAVDRVGEAFAVRLV